MSDLPDDVPMIRKSEAIRWARATLADLEGKPDEEPVPGYWGEHDEQLNVAEVRERLRGMLTTLLVEQHMRKQP